MMGGLRNFWPLCLVILSISLSCFSEARHHSHKPSAVVVGAVFCETCFQDDMSKGSHYISGATVAVECAEGASRPKFYQEIKTDKEGKFKVQLPFSISKHVKKIEGCAVKLVKSSEPYCAVASTATSSLIHLKDKKGGKHIFSAGFFTFKPLKQPGLCNQQPSVTNSQLNSLGDLFQDPEIPSVPTYPQVPTLPTPNPPTSTNPNTPSWPHLPSLPSLPELPKLPTLPFLPPFPETPVTSFKDEKVENGLVKPQQIFPPLVPPVLPSPQGPLPTVPNPFQPPPLLPNPLQPPPSPLIPNPFQPPATPAPLIPNPFQPPSPPPTILPPLPPLPNLPSFPPVPLLTPPPPPPPPPPVLPHIPLLPPLIPGVPPLNAKKVNP